MQEYRIDVGQIEELQTISNKDELDKIFKRAKTTIVNGERVILMRRQLNGTIEKFDEYTTLEELAEYKKKVYKYL
jgi:sRNA-binding regulator protein Hfq